MSNSKETKKGIIKDLRFFRSYISEQEWLDAGQKLANTESCLYRIIGLWRYIAVVFVTVGFLVAGVAQAGQVRKVLVLNSYHPTYEWTKSTLQGIETTLERYRDEIELDVEYMDTKHFNDERHYEGLYALYKNKASRGRYEVIIATDNNALLFLLRYRDGLYPNVPVVFCGVDRFHGSMLESRPTVTSIDSILAGHDLVTGVMEAFDYESTIEIALKFHPSARQVVLVSNDPNEDMYWPPISEEDIARFAQKFGGRVKFISFFLSEWNVGELLKKVEGLGDESIVYLTSDFKDVVGEPYQFKYNGVMILERCAAPVYIVWREWFGCGPVVGGNLVSGLYQGQKAAQMVMRILDGESVQNIPVIRESPNQYMFDYVQMKHFGISLSDLPKGSIVVNQPKSLYYQYKGQFWAVIAVIVTLAAMVILLSANILRRKRAEEALAHSEAIYRKTIENAHGVPYQLRLSDGKYIFMGAGAEELVGIPAKELTREKFCELVEEVIAVGTSTPEGIADYGKRGPGDKIERGQADVRIRTPKGQVKWLNDSFLPVRDEKTGEVIGTIGVLQDITERKRAEGELKQYQFMVESAHDAIFFKDLKSRYIIANNKALEAFGLSPEQVVGKSDIEIMPNKEEAKKNIEDDRLVFKTAKLTEVTKRMTGIDGKERWFQAVKVPQFDDKGNVIGLIGVARDITEHKRAEDALRESEERFRALTESTSDWVWEVDHNGVYTYASPKIRDLLGYGPEEVIGKRPFDLMTPDEAKRVEAIFRDIVESRKPFAALENTNLHKDGRHVVLETSGVPIIDDSGNLLGYRGIDRDITERKRTEDELQKARDELEIRVEQRTADLAKTNIELRSEIAERQKVEEKLLVSQKRLRSLASELSLAEERLRRRIATDVHDHIGQNLAISKIKIESLRESVSSLERAKALEEIRDLLAQTIKSMRSLIFELSPPVLYELGFEAAVEWLVGQAGREHGLSAKFQNDKRRKPLNNNVRVLLFQAVRELLVNVAKHAQARNIKVSTRRVGNQIRVSVEDDGVGFDVSQIRSHDSKIGGFGLFSIRERLGYIGGAIDISSKPGRTRITLVAPIDHNNGNSKEKHK